MCDLQVVDPTPRQMPTKKAIKTHWEPKLLELEKFEDEEDLWESDACFACGGNRFGPTERAHMLPRMYGGSDNVDNLLLLCTYCHKDTEILCHFVKTENIVGLYMDFIKQRTIIDVWKKFEGVARFISEKGLMPPL